MGVKKGETGEAARGKKHRQLKKKRTALRERLGKVSTPQTGCCDTALEKILEQNTSQRGVSKVVGKNVSKENGTPPEDTSR